MCEAFSCIVDKKAKVYWKLGLDNHSDIFSKFKLKEPVDMPIPPTNKWLKNNLGWAKIEINPKDKDYLEYLDKPNKYWKFKVDENIKPEWLSKKHEKECFDCLDIWKEKVLKGINLKEARNPIRPFKIKPPKITQKHIDLLKNWDSVGDSVGDSVWDSVWNSVRNSVWDSVWDSVRDSVWDSVRDSVRDSVGGYYGSLFTNINKWEYVDRRKKCFRGLNYPFQSVIDLWKQGLVPSYDGEKWRLHGGKNAKVLWEGKI